MGVCGFAASASGLNVRVIGILAVAVEQQFFLNFCFELFQNEYDLILEDDYRRDRGDYSGQREN